MSLRNKLKYGPFGTRHWLRSQPSRVSSAVMQLENDRGQVLIVKANYKPYWTFPGGVIEADETPLQAATRETLEEVGIDIPPEQAEFVSVITRTSSVATTYQFVFKAPLLTDAIDRIILQASEIDEYALITRDEIVANREGRVFGKVVDRWAQRRDGYIEQTFDF